jgi:hypothetical protein
MSILSPTLIFIQQGKSLAAIALLHTAMTTTPAPLAKTVLLVVPVNTLANWENGTFTIQIPFLMIINRTRLSIYFLLLYVNSMLLLLSQNFTSGKRICRIRY